MKTLTTLTLAAFTILSLNSNAFAGKIHTLDDIHEAERNANRSAALERRLAHTDPSLLRKIKAEQLEHEESKDFTGKGHKLGGDKYVNRLLGIDHKEGKRLAKLAKKSHKSSEEHASHTKESSDAVFSNPMLLSVLAR